MSHSKGLAALLANVRLGSYLCCSVNYDEKKSFITLTTRTDVIKQYRGYYRSMQIISNGIKHHLHSYFPGI
jgi:hypothetical protein